MTEQESARRHLQHMLALHAIAEELGQIRIFLGAQVPDSEREDAGEALEELLSGAEAQRKEMLKCLKNLTPCSPEDSPEE